MWNPFNYSVDPNMTPEQLAYKRALNANVGAGLGSADYAGSGLIQMLTGLKLGAQNKKLNEVEQTGRQAAQDAISGLFQPLQIGGPGPYQPGISPAPMDPNSPQGIARDAMVAIGKGSAYTPGDKESFIAAMMPHAIAVSQKTGVDPRIVIAQAAQETGWGRSAPNNNFFGIKSHGESGGGTFATNEFIDGNQVTINDSFRGYDSMGDSADGYANFLLENPRYGEMLAADDLDSQLAALGASGYATDPNYAASVGSIAKAIALPGNTPQQVTGQIPTAQIYEALAMPWLSPDERQMLTGMIDTQQRAPMEAIQVQQGLQDLQIGQTQLDAMGQPQPQQLPAAFQSLDLQAQAAGYAPGSPEYQEFMRNGGGSGTPAAFTALDLQAQAAGFTPGTPEYQTFMATRGAGLIAAAKAEGEDKAALDSLSSKMGGLEQVVSQLDALADKATYTYAGQAVDAIGKQFGFEPREAALARAEYIAMVDNQVLPLLRETFGAAFTVKEGETLRATLGNPNASPAEKKAILRAFIEQKRRDVEGLTKRTTPDAPPENSAPSSDPLGLFQ